MELFVNLGCWDLHLDCEEQWILDHVADLFHGRAGTRPRPGAPRLDCRILIDSATYESLSRRLPFPGPVIEISYDIDLAYRLDPPRTLMHVTRTAFIELDDRTPDRCTVWLSPEVFEPDPVSTDPEHLKPLPEAFLFPMLVEWVRNFDACLVHCGAVVLEGKAVMLVGPPGSGKSTHVLRLLSRGARFLADDLAILKRNGDGLRLLPFREVANVHRATLDRFPEMDRFRAAPERGLEKYSVNIPHFFNQTAAPEAPPGVVLHLHPDSEPWLKPRPMERRLEGMHTMAWYASRPAASQNHFELLTELLWVSDHWDVSQGYAAERLDDLVRLLTSTLKNGPGSVDNG